MEVHAELLTRTKMFCRCTNAFGGEVNTRICPVCLGLPGSLPVINKKAVEYVLKTALALNCQIARRSLFHRKNYFYPDLPKGYQISQYGETNPIGYSGWLDIPIRSEENRIREEEHAGRKGEPPVPKGMKRVRIRRVHLEEDTGKLLHLPGGGSGVDYNRSGVPLMEIVTDFPPDMHSAEEAKEYLQMLRLTLIYLGVCDGKMEQGSLRCEPNISIAPEGSEALGVKTELKNLSSFRAVMLGIQHEAERMRRALETGHSLKQETRGWDEERETSYVMRTKEYEEDYRYFVDPDLPPMEFSEETIEQLRASLPELPMEKRRRYIEDLKLSEYDAGLLIEEPAWANFFDESVKLGGAPKAVCNWMNGDFARLLNEHRQTVESTKITPSHIVDLVKLIESNRISGKVGKEVFEQSFMTGKMPSQIVEERGLVKISDESALVAIVREVLAENSDVVEKYRSGKIGVKGFLVGQVMKKTNGRADPEIVNRILEEELAK